MDFKDKPRRLSTNTNLRLIYGDNYQGLPIQTKQGPLIENYLEQCLNTITRALDEHPRTSTFWFILRFPNGRAVMHGEDSRAVEKFIASMKAQISHDQQRTAQLRGTAHGSNVRHIWAKEYGRGGRPHLHCALLLNHDAYHTLGNFQSEQENVSSRIRTAWARALKLSWDQAYGLVEFPANPVYYLKRKGGLPGFEGFFFRVSYLCKAATKVYGDWSHAFGCSRK
ncbi:inovirus Gp2 family protein [Pseudomonas sp. NP21570]|uniref:inovirus Gp2 family protein n=1 Tax=Stutzerimonas kunmingensis TaxID=1211807 RepID=UPI001E3A1D59|nr:inovirus Gp2 family protein [Stutzerimonas kunmingensis]MCB4797180.1 inovirus Gp2 family protein [Pseudomonas sp. NP21570]